MNRSIMLLAVCSSLFICWCMAESFLIQEKPERRRSVQQLKQDIAQVMADVLDLKNDLVTTTGQIQQELCKQIRSIAENDKKAFKQVSSDLQRILKTLHQEKERCEKELAQDKQFLTTLRSNIAC